MPNAIPVSPRREAASGRRNKKIFVIGAACVLVVTVVCALLTRNALHIRAATSSVFQQYVLDHHLGTAEVTNDTSHFQGDFCVLHLDKPIAGNVVENQLVDLMHHYYDLDAGTSLTVEYDAAAGKTVIQGDALYDPKTGIVHITYAKGSEKVSVDKSVHWATNNSNLI